MGRHLIIPDIHQDLFFLSYILERERIDDFDQIVLLGDYFDAYREECSSVDAAVMTAQFLKELRSVCGQRLRMLWGNHDLPYKFSRGETRDGGNPGYAVAGQFDDPVRLDQSGQINRVWPEAMWQGLELAIFCDGWLLSHAGIHPHFWPGSDEPEVTLEEIQTEWQKAVTDFPKSAGHPLLQAGPARAGNGVVGGPVWLDWELEFRDTLPFPQIVGHSRDEYPRRRGRSWCIDCGQSAYAILDAGKLEIRNLTAG